CIVGIALGDCSAGAPGKAAPPVDGGGAGGAASAPPDFDAPGVATPRVMPAPHAGSTPEATRARITERRKAGNSLRRGAGEGMSREERAVTS
ncbi:MAG TPA: hypothetical protein VGJ84_16440, partial [Polyangiaceae bacterium]